MSTIGKRIAAAREAVGLNQSELARLLGVKPQSVQAWEADKNVPRPKKLEGIAGALKVSISHLMGESDSFITPLLTPLTGSEIKGAAARNLRTSSSSGVEKNLRDVVSRALQKGELGESDVSLLTAMAKVMIERNVSSGENVPNLPDELDALAESAFKNADAGGDSGDMVKMIGHGLKKSVAKESGPTHAKRRTGTD